MENYSAGQEEKKISGCVVGCISMVVLVPVIVAVGAYLILMHTTVPLRVVAGLANQAEGVTISGVGGSISSGFTIDELRIDDGDSHESVMEGLVLKWKDLTKLRKSGDLIIEEVSVDRAHFFYDAEPSSEDDDDSEDENSDEDPARVDHDSFDLRVFELRKVDIRKVVFESKTSDFKLEIDELFLKGLRVEEDTFTLEDLSVGSNFVDLQLEDANAVEIEGSVVPFTRQVQGAIKSMVHPSVLKDIDFRVEMGALGGNMVTRVHLFEDSVEVFSSGAGQKGFLMADHFSAAHYFSADLIVLPDDLSITMRHSESRDRAGRDSVEVEGGSFNIGTATFVIAPQVLPNEDTPIVATSSHADLEVRAAVQIAEEGIGLRVELESQPATKSQDLMALLLFENSYGALDVAGRKQVDSSVAHYHFPNSEKAKTVPGPNTGQ